MCSCAHRANVCSSNTGFSPSLSPTSLPPLSPPLMVTRSLPLNFKPNRIYLSILFCPVTHIYTSLVLLLTPHHFHPSIHSLIHLFTHPFWFPPPNFPTSPPPPPSFTSHVSLSLPPSPCPLRSLPPFLSLFHTVLCASLSLAGLLLGG